MNDTKRQNLPAGLWVVATPIGNLEDITPRAKSALERADVILCEDTRRTTVLLSAIGFSHLIRRLERLDAHTPTAKIENWAKDLLEGKNFALVTDAGTPGISDPGAALVAESLRVGVRVTPIPGVSAVVTLLSVSGLQDTAFTFHGYFPRKLEDQKKILQMASSSPLARVHVWFESPRRIQKTLEILGQNHPDVPVVVAKELTKIHEKLFADTAKEVAQTVGRELVEQGELGEWSFVLRFPDILVPSLSIDSASELSVDLNGEGEGALDWVKALHCLLKCNVSVSQASQSVSQYFGISKRISYEIALRISGKKGKKTSEGG